MSISTASSYDYYYGKQTEQFNFYIIPKSLIHNDEFKELSIEAKVLYSIMLDKASLSYQNKWIDAVGRVFIKYTLESIQEDLGCGKGKASKLLKELDTKDDGIGLIEREKGGMGKPDKIYVKNFITEKNKNEVTRQKTSKNNSKSTHHRYENRTSREDMEENIDSTNEEENHINVDNSEVINISCGKDVDSYMDKQECNCGNIENMDNMKVINNLNDTDVRNSNLRGTKIDPKRYENRPSRGTKIDP